MKRDLELIRAILLELEKIDYAGGTAKSLTNDKDQPLVEGWNQDDIAYNFNLMIEGGLVSSRNPQLGPGRLIFNSISWAGHDFLDSVRDPEIWRKTKAVAATAGSSSFGVVKDVAVDLAKELAKHAVAALIG